jgi:hypothetical protein
VQIGPAAWCRTQTWRWRLPIWVYLAYAGARHLIDPAAADIFAIPTFIVHEMGHPLFSYLGEFMGIAGGSIAQLVVPLLFAGSFWRQRDYFAVCVAAYWLSSSLFNLSCYVADARARRLELFSPFAALDGGNAIHDWNYLLAHMGLLRFDGLLGWLVRIDAVCVLAAALGVGAWLLRQMMARKS